MNYIFLVPYTCSQTDLENERKKTWMHMWVCGAKYARDTWAWESSVQETVR